MPVIAAAEEKKKQIEEEIAATDNACAEEMPDIGNVHTLSAFCCVSFYLFIEILFQEKGKLVFIFLLYYYYILGALEDERSALYVSIEQTDSRIRVRKNYDF